MTIVAGLLVGLYMCLVVSCATIETSLESLTCTARYNSETNKYEVTANEPLNLTARYKNVNTSFVYAAVFPVFLVRFFTLSDHYLWSYVGRGTMESKQSYLARFDEDPDTTVIAKSPLSISKSNTLQSGEVSVSLSRVNERFLSVGRNVVRFSCQIIALLGSDIISAEHHVQSASVDIEVLDPVQLLEITTIPQGPVRSGDLVKLTCNAIGYPTPQITWSRTDEGILHHTLSENASDVKADSSIFVGKAVVIVASPEAAATYVCKGSNKVTDPSPTLSYKLDVIYAVRLDGITAHPDGTVNSGDLVNLTCLARGSPEPEITWTRADGMVLYGTDTESQYHKKGAKLVIMASPKTAATYICTAQNNVTTTPKSSTYLLEVFHPVQLLKITASSEGPVRSGNLVKLTCHATGYPSPQITWSRTDEGILHHTLSENASDVIAYGSIFVGKAVVIVASPEAAGTYVCKGSNKVTDPSPTLSYKLDVIYAVRLDGITAHPDGTVNSGDLVNLMCLARGSPEPEITWTRADGMLLYGTDTESQYHKKGAKLVIMASPKAAATYICTAQNNVTATPKSSTYLLEVFCFKMAASDHSELTNHLHEYINRWWKAPPRLKQMLKETPADVRYKVLMSVGRQGWKRKTSLHISVQCNDLELAQCILEGFTPEQMFEVIKTQDEDGNTALNYAVYKNNRIMVEFLLDSLSLKDQLELLTQQGEVAGYPRMGPRGEMSVVQCVVDRGLDKMADLLLEHFVPYLKSGKTGASTWSTGIDVKLQDDLRSAVFPLTAVCGETEALRFLLENLTDWQRFNLIQWRRSNLMILVSQFTQEHRVGLIKMKDSDDSTVLHLAAKKGDAEVVRCLLKGMTQQQRARWIEMKDSGGSTALHLASGQRHAEVVRSLLEGLIQEQRVGLIEMKDSDGSTALHQTATKGDAEVVECLLEELTQQQKVGLIKLQYKDMWNALHLAVKHGHAEMVRQLLEGLNVQQRADVVMLQGKDNKAALHIAANSGHIDMVKFLVGQLTQQQRVNLIKMKDSDGSTAVHLATKNGHVELVRFLLEEFSQQQKAELVALQNKEKQTALHAATRNGKAKLVKLLLVDLTQQQKANLIKIQNEEKQTVIHLGARFGYTKIIEQILEGLTQQKFDLMQLREKEQRTALHFATELGHTEMVKFLLKELTQQQRFHVIQLQGKKQWTALHQSAQNGYTEITRHLLDDLTEQQRFDLVKSQTNNEWTPVHVATKYGRLRVIKCLLENLSEEHLFNLLKIKTADGETALHLALKTNNIEAFLFLLGSLSSEHQQQLLNIPDSRGKTAADDSLQALCSAAHLIRKVSTQLTDSYKKVAELKNQLTIANKKVAGLENDLKLLKDEHVQESASPPARMTTLQKRKAVDTPQRFRTDLKTDPEKKSWSTTVDILDELSGLMDQNKVPHYQVLRNRQREKIQVIGVDVESLEEELSHVADKHGVSVSTKNITVQLGTNGFPLLSNWIVSCGGGIGRDPMYSIYLDDRRIVTINAIMQAKLKRKRKTLEEYFALTTAHAVLDDDQQKRLNRSTAHFHRVVGEVTVESEDKEYYMAVQGGEDQDIRPPPTWLYKCWAIEGDETEWCAYQDIAFLNLYSEEVHSAGLIESGNLSVQGAGSSGLEEAYIVDILTKEAAHQLLSRRIICKGKEGVLVDSSRTRGQTVTEEGYVMGFHLEFEFDDPNLRLVKGDCGSFLSLADKVDGKLPIIGMFFGQFHHDKQIHCAIILSWNIELVKATDKWKLDDIKLARYSSEADDESDTLSVLASSGVRPGDSPDTGYRSGRVRESPVAGESSVSEEVCPTDSPAGKNSQQRRTGRWWTTLLRWRIIDRWWRTFTGSAPWSPKQNRDERETTKS